MCGIYLDAIGGLMTLRTLRQQTGLTQRQLAECLGISRRTVQNYEAADDAPVWYALAVKQLDKKE